MSMPDDATRKLVSGNLGQPTAKGNQVVIPQPTGFGSNRPPEIPNQTVFTPPDAATKKLVTENLGHTSPQIDTSIPPTRATEWAPMGLTLALAGLLAVLCRGGCSLSTLGPALRGFPATPVPGHLQG